MAALTRARRTAAALLLTAALAGCSADDDPPGAARTPSAAPTPASTPSSPPTAEAAAPAAGESLVATAVVDVVEVFDTADATTPARTLDRREETSGELVFLVEEQGAERLRVALPVRPNGSTGWVRAQDVSLAVTDLVLEVRLTDHELVVRRLGAEVLRTPIGVGRQDTPTPGGRYYVKELLQPPSPDGPYGPYAYGLSGFSNELTSFAGGEGVIGIHGTDRPDLVGQDVSSGCIRLANDVVTRLVEEVQVPLGTPVEIVV